MKKHIVIVKGTWGSVTKESAQPYVDLLMDGIHRVTHPDGGQANTSTVDVVLLEEDDRDGLTRELGLCPNILIFLSRSQIELARSIMKQYPIRLVYVLTAWPPEHEVCIVPKHLLLSLEGIQALIEAY